MSIFCDQLIEIPTNDPLSNVQESKIALFLFPSSRNHSRFLNRFQHTHFINHLYHKTSRIHTYKPHAMGLLKTYEQLTSLLKDGSSLDLETINLIVKTLTSSATPKGEVAVEAFQSFVFESMVYAMTRRDIFEKDRKKIVYALCNLNILPWTMDTKDASSQITFITKVMDFLLNMICSTDKNVITIGIEMLIPGK